MQAVITGLTCAVGYLIGTTVESGLRAVLQRIGNATVSRRVAKGARIGLGVFGIVAIGIGLARWPTVQNASRDLVGLEHISWTLVIVITLVAAVLFLAGMVLGRVALFLVRMAERFAQRFMPRVVAWVATIVVVVLVVALSLIHI